jgi:hypothetical protein
MEALSNGWLIGLPEGGSHRDDRGRSSGLRRRDLTYVRLTREIWRFTVLCAMISHIRLFLVP